jgi:DNA-binding PadR family transcriptional regulator
MARPLEEFSAFERDIVVALAGLDEPNGQDLKRELERVYQGEVRNARLYENLGDLVEADIVAKNLSRDRRENVYELTHRGRVRVREHLEWVQSRGSSTNS